ncbi:hypothetical protein N800_06730 [Lysobacter daejeonensis GH1-9]|uniref:Uncharacterized protein n=1 Tax=Lysobacter daejeonensis GH1-9 TaxID=1385517 RepID=A0A0A0EX55_9GAMM|nr:hypothetical protein [Lysobacter daejeonensis]KGM54668.1 hypothetical protein N800_06730 [Lysobacter daejeonensis GH1-9]
MATIIPRTAGPQQQLQATPGVRNTTQVDLSPAIDGIRAVQGVAMDIGKRAKEEADLTALMKAQFDLDTFEATAFDPSNDKGMAKHQGINALGAQDALIPEYDRRAADIRRSLTRDQRARFDQVNAQNRSRFAGRVQGESYRRYELAARETREASKKGGQDSAIAAGIAGDFERQEELIGTVLGMYDASAQVTGESPEVTAEAQRTAISSIHYGTARGLLARPDGVANARAYLDKHQASIAPEQLTHLESILRPAEADAEEEALAAVFVDGGALPGLADGDSDTSSRATTDPKSVQGDYTALAKKHGFSISSMERPVIAVGAGARSQHPKGTAVDYSVKGKTKAQGDALIADLRAAGYEVVDERDGKTGTGPHIHAELPPGRAPAGSAAIAQAATLEDALKQMRAHVTDPQQRKGVEQRIRRTFTDRRNARIESESIALEGMRTAIDEQGADAKSWREAVGPENAAIAVRQGWSGVLEHQWRERRGETLTETDPLVYDRYARLMLDNPAGFASKETRLEILQDAGSLSTADRARLLNEWKELNDPKKREVTLRRRKVEAALVTEGLQVLGWKGTAHKEKAAAFGMAIAQARTTFRDRNQGSDPTPEQDRALVRSLVQSFARRPESMPDAVKSYSRIDLKMEPADAQRARRALADEGVDNPTQDEITRAVLRMKAFESQSQ